MISPSDQLKILIVEDDINSAFILQTILTRAGYHVLPVATDGQLALKKVDSESPELILMDITLPGGFDGIETAQLIKQKRDIPIIYLTGHTSEEVIRRVKETTPFGFILKPYSPKSVLITTEMALHKAMVEREAHETKNRLAVTLGSLRDAVLSTDEKGWVTYLNPAAEQHLQIKSNEAVGISIDTLLNLYKPNHPFEKIASFLTFLSTNSENQTPLPYVLSIGRENEKRWVHLQVNPLLNVHRRINGYVVVISDLTERFYFEKNNRMLASALTSIEDGVLIAEANAYKNDFNIVYLNQGLEKLTHYKAKELLGNSIKCLFCEGFEPRLKNALYEVPHLEQSISEDTLMQRKDHKNLMTNWSISPFYDEEKLIRHLVVIIRDVTRLRQMEENFRQSQKIEAIGRLAGGIAHDFNNLLSVINGYSDLLKVSLDKTSTAYPYVINIHEAGQRGADLVSQLMMFSRQEIKQEKELLDLKTVASNTLRMLSHWLGKQIKLKIYLDNNLWPVWSQPTYIDQILVNLCVNAKDAMPQGGTLTVSIKNFEYSGESLNAPLGVGRYVVIVVGDTGMGISAEIQKKMFEPFFTTKPIGQGTGLGLSTVYGIVKQHSGYIQVQSALNQGSTFNIYLPIAREENNPPLPKKTTLSQPTAYDRATVAIVYEDLAWVECLRNLLMSSDCALIHSKNLEEFTEILAKQAIDLLVIDATMVENLLKISEKKLMLNKVPLLVLPNTSVDMGNLVKENRLGSLYFNCTIPDDLAVNEAYKRIKGLLDAKLTQEV